MTKTESSLTAAGRVAMPTYHQLLVRTGGVHVPDMRLTHDGALEFDPDDPRNGLLLFDALRTRAAALGNADVNASFVFGRVWRIESLTWAVRDSTLGMAAWRAFESLRLDYEDRKKAMPFGGKAP